MELGGHGLVRVIKLAACHVVHILVCDALALLDLVDLRSSGTGASAGYIQAGRAWLGAACGCGL